MNHSENKAVREPFVRIAKRNSIYWTKAVMIRVLAIIAALVVDALIIYFVTKLNPIKVYVTMFEGAFGTKRRVWITVREIMMLLCIAVGLAPAFKMRFWNVGAEGQILVGGIATAACMIYLNSLPTPLLLLVMFIASAIAGAIWGLIPAIFKAKWDTNEMLFTLMMNYVAIQATMIAVKPRPPAVLMEMVWSAPATPTMPATPHTAPEMSMVRMTTRLTLMPA